MARLFQRFAAVLLLTGLCGFARADSIQVLAAAVERADEGYGLNADFSFELTARLDEALHKGVSLYFLLEFECERPRWYWFNERIAQRTVSYRVSYHSLTREYRLSYGPLHLGFASLDETIRTLSRVRGLPVIESGRLEAGETYVAQVRMRLDVTQLPKPFQVSALTNRDLTLASDWYRWRFALPTTDAAK